MNALTPFVFENNSIRIIDADGNPWFVLRDLLDSMGSSTRPADAKSNIIENLGDGVVADYPIVDSMGREQQAIIVAESAATYLVARSNTDRGRKLNRFIHVEVLPSIRKTGGYQLPAPAVELSRMDLIQLALSAEKERLALEQHVEIIQPKADAFDRIATSTCGSLNLTNAAKSLQVQPCAFIQRLSSMRWIYKRAGGRSWIAYQNRLQQGVLEHKVAILTDAAGTEKVREQVFVTAQGLALLAKALNQQPASTPQLPQLNLNGMGGAA